MSHCNNRRGWHWSAADGLPQHSLLPTEPPLPSAPPSISQRPPLLPYAGGGAAGAYQARAAAGGSGHRWEWAGVCSVWAAAVHEARPVLSWPEIVGPHVCWLIAAAGGGLWRHCLLVTMLLGQKLLHVGTRIPSLASCLPPAALAGIGGIVIAGGHGVAKSGEAVAIACSSCLTKQCAELGACCRYTTGTCLTSNRLLNQTCCCSAGPQPD